MNHDSDRASEIAPRKSPDKNIECCAHEQFDPLSPRYGKSKENEQAGNNIIREEDFHRISNQNEREEIQGHSEDARRMNPEFGEESREERLHRIRHSSAHILAQAVSEHFADSGEVLLGVGPAIRDGFYYDFCLPRPISDSDLDQLEIRMREIIAADFDFSYEEISKEQARLLFANQPMKKELIELIDEGELDVDAESKERKEKEEATFSIYKHSDFVDLCRGPHVSSSAKIDPSAIKLLRIAGAYWRGDEAREMLVRIYGTAWESKKELENYLQLCEEAKRRDHRVIGKRLKLFHFDDLSPGMPYWLPDGMKILNSLIDFWRREHSIRGYEEISTPLLNDKRLYEISGHWEHYKENMFVSRIGENSEYGLKPMNCPNSMVVYNLELRSYRDLPVRLSDCDVLHRNERSGTLSGLFRVQKFQQDDAHIFVSQDQIEEEFERIFELTDYFYSLFDLSYSFRLSLRPADYVGELEVWDSAEKQLERILEKRVGKGNFQIAPGEGAFYGPKVDILMTDSLGRKWQMGTIQLDFQLPARFKCKYIDAQGKARVPVVIHRVIYGSLDRFIAILLEHCGGDLPLWLAPRKSIILPIADRHNDYASSIRDILASRGIICSIDNSSNRLAKRIREAELMKIPYIVVLGDAEQDSHTISVRIRGGERKMNLSPDEFASRISENIENRDRELPEI